MNVLRRLQLEPGKVQEEGRFHADLVWRSLRASTKGPVALAPAREAPGRFPVSPAFLFSLSATWESPFTSHSLLYRRPPRLPLLRQMSTSNKVATKVEEF